jgi:hypothetical protein
VVTALGAVMMLLAIGTMGCGGGNSGVTPFAGVWVANNSAPPTALHFPGADIVLAGTFGFPPTPRLTSALVAPQDTLFDSNNNLWIVNGGNGAGAGPRFTDSSSTRLSASTRLQTRHRTLS